MANMGLAQLQNRRLRTLNRLTDLVAVMTPIVAPAETVNRLERATASLLPTTSDAAMRAPAAATDVMSWFIDNWPLLLAPWRLVALPSMSELVSPVSLLRRLLRRPARQQRHPQKIRPPHLQGRQLRRR